MESVKKWLSERAVKKNGLYVHYSPPRTLGEVSGAQLRQWARGGSDSRLERAVLAGQGRRLMTEAVALPLAQHLPALMAKCSALHAAVTRGSLAELQTLLESEYNRRKYVMCTDEAGVGLLHKAIYYDFMDIAEWLVQNYPQIVHQKDSEGRTPLHYTALCRDEAGAAALLERAGAARGARDAAGRTPAYYRGPSRARLVLPAAPTASSDMPRRNGNNPSGMVIKRSNIRIWFHDCDMARLQRVVWDGHGAQLLSEVSNQPVVRKFLEAVPYIMNTIREIHSAVVLNDLEGVMKHSGDPVPPVALSSRDANNMTVFHKAAGLGHGGILKYLAERYPQGVNDVDNDGRTPLHYAAAVRDEQHVYNTLVGLGADESVVDNKNKTPAYYINRPQEIDRNMLKVLPEAPRTPSSAYPSTWDWKLLDTEVIAELNKKSRRRPLKASTENISSQNTASESTENVSQTMKSSSTHELIKDLPDLEDSSKILTDGNKKPKKENIITDNKDSEEDKDQKNSENIKEEPEETDEVKEINNEVDSEKSETAINEENNDEANEEEAPKDKDAEEIENDVDKNSTTAESEHGDQINDLNQAKSDSENDAENEKETQSETEQEESKDITNEDNAPETIDGNEETVTDADDEHTNDANEENENISEEQQENGNDINASMKTDTHNLDDNNKEELHDDPEETGNEGNHNTSDNEDDSDVQVPGESQSSEYSEFNLKSTAEATSTASAMRGNQTNGRSTQESLIEGIVNEDVEMDSQDASITQRDGPIHGDVLIVDNEIDPEVTDLISTANMEMLAALVLNGEGARLVGRTSSNTELQAFLDNVPIYMKKIHKVHMAAQEGNIRDLQAALDRRKFAIARDPISANGATPLHVATIFGKTNIIKYLGGRFPETLSAVDFEGRTALHYAAILPDNGHYYNLLQQLGANSKDLDDNGRSAEEYYRNTSLLSLEHLLADFGISEDAMQDMLSDKVPEDNVSSRRLLDAPEAKDTLERCYRLLASARPSRTPLSASSNRATPPLVLGRFLRRTIFDAVKERVTKLDHDLFDVIWPAVKKLPDSRNIVQTVEEDFPGGIAAPDYCAYAVFEEFLTPLIKDLHNMNVHSDLPEHPKSDFISNQTKSASNSSSEPFVELNIDPKENFILSGNMECMRNLRNFELPLNLTVGQLEEIERILTTVLLEDEFTKFNEQSNPESDQKGGTYYTMNEVLEKPSSVRAMLASAGLLIALCDKDEIDDYTRLHGKFWPYGRGVFVSDDKTAAVWINVHDHLRLLTSTPTDAPGEIGLPFSRLSYIMTYLHSKLEFTWDPKLGHLSCRPTFLGSGIHFSLIAHFPGLTKDRENLKHLCAMRGLQYRETLTPDIARISNYQSLSITESNCFNDFSTATSNLLHLEKDFSMQNSAQIATMLTNIFRRKRSSLVDSDSSEKY